MRALGDVRRKAPVEQKKEETPVAEVPTPVETQPTETFDESVALG